MDVKSDYIPFVIKAQQGDREALNDLVSAARKPLEDYIRRMTLNEEVAQDLVQDSLLTMVRQFETLRVPEGFWSWLSHIALNKVRTYYRANWRKRKPNDGTSQGDIPVQSVQDTLGEVIGNEIKQIVVTALNQLTPEHRVVITLRCYEQLTFPQMAALLGCSEFKARTLFYRARKALGKNLTLSGLGKDFLVGALIIFGKLSASSETAVAGIAITEASLRAGLLPTVVGVLTGKVMLSVAAVIAVSVSVSPFLTTLPVFPQHSRANVVGSTRIPPAVRNQDTWYYYPPGYPGTVHIRTRETRSGQDSTWQFVQNEAGNYQRRGRHVILRNAHLWQPDLSVWRLPTDPTALRQFLDEVEGCQTPVEGIDSRRGSLLVIQGADEQGPFQRSLPGFDITDEEFFIHPWPSEMPQVDERDALHQQGWGYFRVSGHLSGRAIHGTGRLPLVSARYRDYGPRLQLSVGGSLLLEDDSTGAWVGSESGGPHKHYRAGYFFNGLSRPWMGLHSLDTVRRDAARYCLSFETHPRQDRDTNIVTVSVFDGDLRFDYQIDMERDLVCGIDCFRSGMPCGHIQIEYLESFASDEGISGESKAPGRHRQQSQGPKRWWLTELIHGDWFDTEMNP